MATNINGTLNGALIAQEGLALLFAKYPLIKNIVSDFSNEPVLYNQTLITRIPSVGTVQSFDPANGYVAAAANATDVSVTLNQFKHATFSVSDAELSSTRRDLIAEYSKDFATALGENIMSAIAGLFVSTNFANKIVVPLASATRDTVVVAANTDLNSRNVDKGRFGIFNSQLYGQMMTDPTIISKFFGGEGIEDAELPVVHGVKITDYSALPSTGNLQGVIGAKDAIVFASRVPSDAGMAGVPETGKTSVVTDENSGLSVQVRESYNFQTAQRYITFALIYGCSVGNPLSLDLITTA